MLRFVLIAALAVSVSSVSGCSRLGFGSFAKAERTTFDGQRFRGKARATTGKEPVHFVSTVNGVSKSLDGAIAAAEHQGKIHCIKYYGTSDIDWEVGPDTPREALGLENDSVTFMGTCRDR